MITFIESVSLGNLLFPTLSWAVHTNIQVGIYIFSQEGPRPRVLFVFPLWGSGGRGVSPQGPADY